MTTRTLEAPVNFGLLYEFRQSEEPVPDTRPLAQGDVLRDVELPGGQVLGLAMIVAHPCSMRKGLQLRPRLVVAEVEPSPVHLSKWPKGHFDFFPLPELEASGKPVAVHFQHLHTVETQQLETRERVAVLSDYGQLVFQQRWIYHIARVVADRQELTELIAPIQNELSMQMDWVDAGLAVGAPGDRTGQLGQLAKDFQDFLDEPSDPDCLRARLKQGESDRIFARKAVRAEIKKRYPSG